MAQTSSGIVSNFSTATKKFENIGFCGKIPQLMPHIFNIYYDSIGEKNSLNHHIYNFVPRNQLILKFCSNILITFPSVMASRAL